MVNSDLSDFLHSERRPRVCAVSYLNTAPLVWGALYGPQNGTLDLTFAFPSTCADRVASGEADLGLVPVVEMDRFGLDWVRGLGIASRGAARSILLVSRVPFAEIRTLAADSGSRTSVQLARIILERRFQAEPETVPMDPDLGKMLEAADAALLIGDAALRVDPASLPACLDLGTEWEAMTGLPMVFAVWAGRAEHAGPEMADLLKESLAYGLGALDTIIEEEARRRGFAVDLVEDYLRNNMSYWLGEKEEAGLRLFLEFARQLNGR